MLEEIWRGDGRRKCLHFYDPWGRGPLGIIGDHPSEVWGHVPEILTRVKMGTDICHCIDEN